MKLKHWVFVMFALVGVLYFVHVYTGHGGMSGFRTGLKIGA